MPRFVTPVLASAIGLAMFAAGSSALAQEGGGKRGPIADHCSGTKLQTRVLRDNVSNRRIGRVELWYSPAEKGTNCVITYNEVPGKAWTYAWLIIDDNKNRDNTGRTEKGDRVSYDQGQYEYYAGASFRRNTNGKCVKWGGTVNSRRGNGSFGSKWVHCN
jgi:hypothetical protein